MDGNAKEKSYKNNKIPTKKECVVIYLMISHHLSQLES
jgi:hypothetical protein